MEPSYKCLQLLYILYIYIKLSFGGTSCDDGFPVSVYPLQFIFNKDFKTQIEAAWKKKNLWSSFISSGEHKEQGKWSLILKERYSQGGTVAAAKEMNWKAREEVRDAPPNFPK